MTGIYSLELVALSFLVAACASYVAFALAAHIAESEGWTEAYWLAGGAIAMGTGVWSMHFIGLLALKLPIPVSYGVEATMASLAIAIATSGFGLYVASSRELSLAKLTLASVAMGVGIAAVHYVCVSAMEVSPPPTYDGLLVAVSLLIAVGASAVALALAFRLRSSALTYAIGKRISGAFVLALGIAGMHYAAMAATEFAPGTVSMTPDMQVDQYGLAIAVAVVSLLLLGATMMVLTIDMRLIQQLDEANARISALACEDPLTGLANRRTFLDNLEGVFESRSTDKSSLAVLFLDLDGFKEINDTLGHAVGDALLIEVADRLRRTVRKDDLVARFGGDEFAILQKGIVGPDDAGTLAEKVREAVAQRFSIGSDDLLVTASIGVAQVSENTGTPADLMVQADLALYRAKDDGRNRYCFHNSDLDRQVHTRVLMPRELRLALERGELELTYQPQVEIASGHIVGLEVSTLWNHPSRGIIKPSVYIPIAERTGTILAIGTWMIAEALHQMRRWQDNGIAPPLLAIDISRGQLKASADLAADLMQALDEHGVPAASIELELDEGALMHTAERHHETMQKLRRAGFRIALNDFGCGHSSIGLLAREPVDRLKISSSIVTRSADDEAAARTMRVVSQIGRELGASVIASGVETQAQAVLLMAAGCELAQGPFFAPRLSEAEATALLRHRARTEPAGRGVSSSSAA